MEYKVISADDHIDLRFLPRDLWTSRVPSALKDGAPHVVEGERGPDWVCGDQMMGPWGFYTGAQGSGAVWAIERGGALQEGPPRPTTPALRLADMDRDGVDASVLYGPPEGFLIDDRQMRRACFRAYNDWLAEFCASSPGRFIGAAQLDYEDPEFSADELARVVELGLRHVNVLGALAAPPLYDEAWERFWSVAEDTNVPIGSHVIAVVRRDRRERQSSVDAAISTVFSQPTVGMAIAGLIMTGVFDRHPGLRVVMAESQLAWVPNVVQRLDRWYKGAQQREGLTLQMLPSEYFQQHVWMTFQDDPAGVQMIPPLSEDRVMWASDYPHPASTWPESQDVIDRQLGQMPASLRHKIVVGNALDLYGISELVAS